MLKDQGYSLYRFKEVTQQLSSVMKLDKGLVWLQLLGKQVTFTTKGKTFTLDGKTHSFVKQARIHSGSLYVDLASLLKAMGYQVDQSFGNQINQSLGNQVIAYKVMGNYERGVVHWTPANPEQGFHYGYYFYLPKAVTRQTYAVVEPNNAPTKLIPYEQMRESAKSIADRLVGWFAEPLNMPLLVPAFVGTDSLTERNSYFPHALNSVAMADQRPEFKRFDLQLLAMHADLQKKLRLEGVVLYDKLCLTGFSDSGNFVDRFTLIHPERVKIAVAGGHNLLAMPTNQWKSQILNYPYGTANYEQLFGRPFDLKAFNGVHKLHYRANDDDKDPIYGVNHTPGGEKEMVLANFGTWQQRVQRYQGIFEALGVERVQFNFYDGIGHTIPKEVVADILRFIQANRGDTFVKTAHHVFIQEATMVQKTIRERFKKIQFGASKENSESLGGVFGGGSGTSAINLSESSLNEKNVDFVVIWNDGVQPLNDYIVEMAGSIGFKGSSLTNSASGTYAGWVKGRFWVYIESSPGTALDAVLNINVIANALASK